MSIFYVNQTKTYKDEKEGGFVWSPKFDNRGKDFIGYTTMTFIKKNDLIIHCSSGKLKAISIAKSDCHDSKKPDYKYFDASDWPEEGYRVDTDYTELENSVIMANHREWLSKNYVKKSSFNRYGRGKQQYMSQIDDKHAFYLLDAALKRQKDETISEKLKCVIFDIKEDQEEDNYTLCEQYEINNIINNQSGKPTWSGEKKEKEKNSNSIYNLSYKRDPKCAADALARAEYKCEANKKHKLFKRKSGKDYTEPHHLIPLSKGKDFDYSVDVMENIVSLCSHCHNLLHYGRLEDKKPILEKLYNERKEALSSVGLEITFEKLLEYYE